MRLLGGGLGFYGCLEIMRTEDTRGMDAGESKLWSLSWSEETGLRGLYLWREADGEGEDFGGLSGGS